MGALGCTLLGIFAVAMVDAGTVAGLPAAPTLVFGAAADGCGFGVDTSLLTAAGA
jgi:hypothetical protein